MARRHVVACLALAVASACSSFGSDTTAPTTADAGADASSPPNTSDAGPTGCNGCPVELVASGMPQILGIVADESFIYVGTNASPGNVYRVPKAVNSSATVLAEGYAYPNALTLHGDDVYFATVNGAFRVLKTGGMVAAIDPTRADAIAVDDAFVYTCHWDAFVAHDVLQIPIGGGPAKPIASGSVGCETFGLAGGFLYYGDSDSLGWIDLVHGGDGEVHHYASRRIVVDAGEAFSLGFFDSAVRYSSLDPKGMFGTVATNPNDQFSNYGEIAVDATHVYWTVGMTNGSVYRAPRTGGPPELIADKMAVPTGIAVDATAVYWGERDSGRLWRRLK